MFIGEDMSEKLFSDRVKLVVDLVGNASRLGSLTGITPKSIGIYMKGGSDPSREKLVAIAKAANVNLEWLATGEGPIYKGEADKREEGEGAAPAPWQPAPPRVDNSQPAPDATFDTLDVVEGMTMLTRIYGSGDTTYIRAINANLMAFSDAITAKTTNQTMQGQLNKLEDRLATLEQSLESPPKAANGD